MIGGFTITTISPRKTLVLRYVHSEELAVFYKFIILLPVRFFRYQLHNNKNKFTVTVGLQSDGKAQVLHINEE